MHSSRTPLRVPPLRTGTVLPVASSLEHRALDLLDELTASIPGGEIRPGQRQMVEAVASHLGQSTNLVIEAGTGTGKSLGYLIPAALLGEPVVVVTATKNLQDQLAGKDAPAVTQATHTRVEVLKGRSNYLCLERFADFQATPDKGLDSERQALSAWSASTQSGDREEMTSPVSDATWRRVSVTPQECLGRQRCPYGETCLAEQAKERAAEADIIIVNAHLYASHLATGQTLLPPHEYVVFDEAHDVNDIFSSMLGTSVSPGQLNAAVAAVRAATSAKTTTKLSQLTAEFAGRLEESNPDEPVGDILRVSLVALYEEMAALDVYLREQPSSTEIQRAKSLLTHAHGCVGRALAPSEDEIVYLRISPQGSSIEVALIDVASRLRQELWPVVVAVLTSATIPANLERQLGLPPETERLSVPSPFNYADNSLLYVPSGLPERNDPACEPVIVEHLVELISAARGRTLALFTNTAVMRRVASEVAAQVATPVLVQGEMPRGALTAAFRDDPESSLFAVASFWQGVDVPGHSLSVVTIDRLPFRPPGDPVNEARRERSNNPFFEIDLPHVTSLLAQGVGRLIRTTSDRGVVAVFDERLATKGYRSQVLDALPPMRRTRSAADVKSFLEEILREHE